MKKLKKAAAGVLTLALSFSIVGTSVAPTFADDIGKNLEECQKAVTKAQEEYDAAETAYDNGAVKFLESKMCDYHRENLTAEKYIKNIQNATGRNADLVLAAMENRDKFFTKNDGTIDIEKKELYRRHWITFDNLKLQATWLKELNKDRENDENKKAFEEDGKSYSQSPLKLNAELMMDSMMSAMVTYFSDFDPPHLLAHTSRESIPRGFYYSSENLTSVPVNPLTAWYDYELSLYNDGNRETEDIGHYRACMMPADFVGFGMYAPSDSALGGTYDIAAMRVSFSENWTPTRIEETGYTAEEWLKMVNEAEAPLKKNLDEAKANLDAAKKALEEATKPDFANADAAREKANKLNKADYTEKTWNAVETALNELNKAYRNENLTQEDLNKVVANLNAAMNNLEKKPVNPNPEPSKPEPSNPEPENPKEDIAVNKVVLSASKYTYNGKTHTPSVKVYDQKGKMLSADRYTVKYSSGRKNLGSYTVSVYGKSDVTGTASAKYVITPAKMKTPSVKAGKKKITVKWKKLGGGSQSYQIYVLKKGTKKGKYYTSTGSSKTIKKLSKKKYYYTKIRSYKKINGKTYYGTWSNTKKVKVK